MQEKQQKRHIGLDLGVKSRSKVYIIDQEGKKLDLSFTFGPIPKD